jgi:arylsulfatase A-like enzyme
VESASLTPRIPWALALPLAAILLAVIYFYGKRTSPELIRPRNVILLSVDTLNWSDLRVLNPLAAPLPNLDRFSRRAVCFTNAYTPSSWTLPAHASLLTGLYPDRHGATDRRTKLGSDIPTLASWLREAGFETVAFTGGGLVDHRYGLSTGFDRYDDWLPSPDWRPELKLPRSGKRPPIARADIFDRAIAFLSHHRPEDPPLFLFLHTYAVHDYFKSISNRAAPLPDEKGTGASLTDCLTDTNRCSRTEWEQLRNLYEAELLHFDEGFAGLLDALNKSDLGESTLLVVLSDHGEGFDYDAARVHHSGRLHHDLVRVPVLVAGPGIRPRIAETPISLVDVAPSILDVLNVEPGGPMDGTSFAGTLYPASLPGSSERAPSWNQRVLYAMEHAFHWTEGTRRETEAIQTRPISIAIIGETLWYIHDQAREELYDMELDPHQGHNLAPTSSRLPMVRELAKARLTNDAPIEKLEMDKELEELLRSLGYIR